MEVRAGFYGAGNFLLFDLCTVTQIHEVWENLWSSVFNVHKEIKVG